MHQSKLLILGSQQTVTNRETKRKNDQEGNVLAVPFLEFNKTGDLCNVRENSS